VKLVSARWVVPIVAPPIAEGAVALADDGTVLAVGTRAEVCGEFPDAPEERAAGVLMPGLVNAHAHLEISHHADAVPGGEGFFAWAGLLMGARKADTPAQQREGAATAAAAAVALGTAAVGDVGSSLAAAHGIGRAGLAGVLFHELFGSREIATGDALADAARERAESAAEWPAHLGYVPAPHAPFSVGPELLTRIFAAAAASGRATSIHVAEDEDEVALLRDGSGRWPAFLAGMGVDPTTRVPRKSPVAYLASLGAFQTETPPLLVHMVHADARDLEIARNAGATVVLCPRSNLHIGGRLPDVGAIVAGELRFAIGTDSLASTPDLSLWGEMATLAAHFPSVRPSRWLGAATLSGARALGLRGYGVLSPGARPGVLDVLVDDLAAPLESLVRDPSPTLRWVARAS
jgi:cytosine/adenosine deaminase-related metal-dependent hydrolase